jgi:hypothetical protein
MNRFLRANNIPELENQIASNERGASWCLPIMQGVVSVGWWLGLVCKVVDDFEVLRKSPTAKTHKVKIERNPKI